MVKKILANHNQQWDISTISAANYIALRWLLALPCWPTWWRTELRPPSCPPGRGRSWPATRSSGRCLEEKQGGIFCSTFPDKRHFRPTSFEQPCSNLTFKKRLWIGVLFIGTWSTGLSCELFLVLHQKEVARSAEEFIHLQMTGQDWHTEWRCYQLK